MISNAVVSQKVSFGVMRDFAIRFWLNLDVPICSRSLASLSIQDLEDEEEHVDDVEVEGDGREDVAVFVELEASVLAANDHLRVVHQEEAVDEDAEAGEGQVHLWTQNPHHEARHRQDHGEDPDEGTAHREVGLGSNRVEGQADDHGCRDAGCLKDDGW